MKVGIGIADIMCGMYATSAILAALHHKARTGEGQHIDLALLDTQVAWLANEAINYSSRASAEAARNEHPNIVPYKLFETRDGPVVLAAGNDGQFQRLCRFRRRGRARRRRALSHELAQARQSGGALCAPVPLFRTRPRPNGSTG
jgi:crotonobetainyl-CoA:carnitine CoA-transferase CaiB-like acyl-CoA transferase